MSDKLKEMKQKLLKELDELKATYQTKVEERKKIYKVNYSLDILSDSQIDVIHGVIKVRKTLR